MFKSELCDVWFRIVEYVEIVRYESQNSEIQEKMDWYEVEIVLYKIGIAKHKVKFAQYKMEAVI